MPQKILYGKRTILFPLEAVDIPHFVKLHREDRNGYLLRYCLKKMTEDEAAQFIVAAMMTGQVQVWSGYTKNGKASRCIGFIYLNDLTSFSACVSGVMDNDIIKGLGKRIKDGQLTYAEDASITIIDYCFNDLGMERVETSVLETNRRALLLDKKVGWKVEGRARHACKLDDGFKDLIQLGIIKEDWRHGTR